MKLDRFVVWFLLGSMFIYTITGFGMTKGIISAKTATQWHLDILPYIMLVSFVIHTSWAIHLALIRWRIWNRVTKTLLVLIYAGFVGFFVYLESFYTPKWKTNNINSSTPSSQNVIQPTPTINVEVDDEDIASAKPANTPAPTASATSTEKVFTKSELAKYNGQNSQSAYVAVDGIVYDVTSIFSNGAHFSHFAGQDLTQAFYIRHVASQIKKYPVVGKMP